MQHFFISEHIITKDYEAYRGIVFEIDPDSGAAQVADIFECNDEYWLSQMLKDSVGQESLYVACYSDVPGAVEIGNQWVVPPTKDPGSRVRKIDQLFFQTLRRERLRRETP